MSSPKVLFGFHAVGVRLKTAPQSIIEIHFEPTRRDARMRQFLDKAREANARLIEADGLRIAKLAGSHGHQGVAARYAAARTYSENSKGYLAGSNVGPRYTTWFGAYTSSRYNTAEQHFVDIDAAMDQNGGQITVNCGCNQSAYAYVYPTRPYEIFVCRAFWSAPNTGTDSKAGTLVHEMSHFNIVAGETVRGLTDRMIAAMYQDFDALGIARPTHDPRATDYVPQMLDIVRTLEDKGLAYRSGDGDVNYAVRRFPGYGKLSGKTLDELQAGERVAVSQGKEDPLDFVLWKASKPEEPPEAKWDSEFGAGRPGWHIECSAMACELLGQTFDIHGGGADLQFPHHENEIAQSEGANGQPLARFWMHNGFINVDNEKMSKSLGNFFTIRDVLQQYDAETVRFFIVRAHYRSALNYSDAHLDDARQALKRLYTALSLVAPAEMAQIDWTDPYAARFKAAMDEDFGTPEAVAVLFDLAGEVNKSRSPALAGLLRALGGCLGVLQGDPLPDLILLDLNMPKLSGLEVLKFIRQNPQLHCCKVAMLTTSVNPNDEQACRDAGADLYLVKPSSFEQLVELCDKLLHQVLPIPRSAVVEVFYAR